MQKLCSQFCHYITLSLGQEIAVRLTENLVKKKVDEHSGEVLFLKPVPRQGAEGEARCVKMCKANGNLKFPGGEGQKAF